jgi:hypothetical protein
MEPQQQQQQQPQQQQQIDYGEIETKASDYDTKLPELKCLGKSLKIKITKLKKEEIREAILAKTYDPKRYLDELYNANEKTLNEKELKDKNGADYWLHKFTKYSVQDNYFILIVKLHPHQIAIDDEFTYRIDMLDIKDMDKIKPNCCLFNFIRIKTRNDIELIKSLCNEKNVQYKELSREHLTDLDRVCRIDFIDEIIGYGSLCMQSKPCTHSLKYVGVDGKTYTIRYAGYRFIRDIYLKLCDNDIEEIPEHFQKKR